MSLSTGHKGIDVKETANRLVFDVFLQDMSGILVTSGTTKLYLYEVQNDGTLNSYDFSSNIFTSGVLTNAFGNLTHRRVLGNTANTGIWTSGLTTLTGFSQSGIYYAHTNHTNAMPNDQMRKFQFGSEQGDVSVDRTYGVKADIHGWKAGNPSGLADAVLMRNVSGIESIIPEHSLGTVILSMLENSISGTTLTIKKTDGSTLFTKTLTLNVNASPITAIT